MFLTVFCLYRQFATSSANRRAIGARKPLYYYVNPGRAFNFEPEALNQKMAVACLETDFQWFALRVRTRAERTAGDILAARGFDVFCPVYAGRRKSAHGLKIVNSALFPGYLFCKLEWRNRLRALSAPNVESIVGFDGGPTPIDEAEIDSIRAIMQSDVPLRPHPFLQIGQRVRMRLGPFAEVEGILTGKRGDHRLIVSVSLLHRSVAVEIDSLDVEPLLQ